MRKIGFEKNKMANVHKNASGKMAIIYKMMLNMNEI